MNFFRIQLFHFINWISRTFFSSRLSYSHIEAFLFTNSWKKFSNLIKTHWSIWRGYTKIKTKPYIFVFEVTNICNLKCPFCLTGKGISGGREVRHMSYQEAQSIIDAVADTTYLLQLYTWGEPLLNKDILKIIEYAKQKDIYVMLSTNATAMTATYNEKLLDSGIDYITVAIDGGSVESYAKYRIGGHYDKVLSNVKNLLEQKQQRKSRRPFVEWQYVVFRHNEHEVKDTEQMAYQIGINKFTPLPAYAEDEEWLPTSDEFRQTELYNPERLQHCERPWSHLNVRADGGIASCCYEFFKKDDFGNLSNHNFDEIWNNEFFTESRKLIHMKNKGLELPKSDLICYDCLQTGIRPSFVEKEESEEKVITFSKNQSSSTTSS